MNDSKQRIDLLEEIMDEHAVNHEAVEAIKEHFVLVPIQDLPEPVKREYAFTFGDLIVIHYSGTIDPELHWNAVLAEVAAIRFQQEMVEFQKQQRRDELAREFTADCEGFSHDYKSASLGTQKAIDHIIEMEDKP